MNFLANMLTGAALLFHAVFGGVPTPILGAAVPQAQALFETSLQSSITTTATTATLVSGIDFAGNNLNGYYCFTIDSGQPNVEFVCGNASGTALTNLTRGVNPALGISANTGLQQTHRRGADVKQTDAPYISLYSQIFNGSSSIPGTLYYQSLPTFTSSTQIVDKQYVDQVATSGAPDAGIASKGLVAIGTPLGAATSTDGSSLLYTLPSLQYYASSSQATTSIVVTNGSGTIDASFINTSGTYGWSGKQTFASTTIFTSNPTISSATSSILATASSGLISPIQGNATGSLLSFGNNGWQSGVQTTFSTSSVVLSVLSTYQTVLTITLPNATPTTLYQILFSQNASGGNLVTSSTIILNGTTLVSCTNPNAQTDGGLQFILNIAMQNTTTSEAVTSPYVFMNGDTSGCKGAGQTGLGGFQTIVMTGSPTLVIKQNAKTGNETVNSSATVMYFQ